MATPEQIAKAKDMGWFPKEQFNGNPADFIDADEFVSRGEKLLPIMKANNRKLSQTVRDQGTQIQNLNQQLQQVNQTLGEFQKQGLQARLDRLKADKQRTLAAKTAAIQADDAAGQTEADDALNRLNGEISEAEKAVGTATPATRSGAPPQPNAQAKAALDTWRAANPWYGQDARKTRYADGVALELRNTPGNENLVGAAFFQKVDEEVAREFPTRRSQDGKLEPGGNGSGGGGGSGGGDDSGHSYSDLPADAKQVCDRQANNPRLVGKGKQFETKDQFREHYATQYDWS